MRTGSSRRCVGVDRVELVGRRLGDLVPPEYAELVTENIRRRLAGEPAAERYEIEMVGLQGQMSRLEITSAVIDYEGEPALLVTGVEIIPTQTVPALKQLPADAAAAAAASPAHLFALDSLAEAIIATDLEGRITYLNAAAERLTGTSAANAIGKTLEEIVGLVDETERRVLNDPVQAGAEQRRAGESEPARAAGVARRMRASAPSSCPPRRFATPTTKSRARSCCCTT